MINKIGFKNYKSFKNMQELELKPLTILIGKNSSGKSAVAKLPTLIEGSLSRKFEEALLVTNNDIDLGAEFRDIVYGRDIGSVEFILQKGINVLKVEITSGLKDSELPRIRNWKLNNELSLNYDDTNKLYLNEISHLNCSCKFLGFDLVEMSTHTDIIDQIPSLIDKGIVLKTNYIGPFREIPVRNYPKSGVSKINRIGNKGENAYQILINDYLIHDSKLLKNVNDWYKKNFDGWGITINSIAKPDYKIELTRDFPKFNINIRDVGEGMSQALPLIVSALMELDKDTLTIIEQPELHLHPAAHGSLAELFALSAKTYLKHYLIETHSQNFILRLRRLVAEGIINCQDLIIYSIDYDEETNTSNLNKITVSKSGDVSYWPENVFSETLDEAIAIRSAQKKGEESGNKN